MRNRLRNYLQKNDKGPWKEALMKQAHDFDVTLTHTELEALVLETNLIKELRPKYNVLMKDGKNYVYVRISGDPYPTVDVVRKMDPSPPERSRVGEGGRAGGNKAKYFGPYLSAWETRRMLDLLHEFFPFRACRESLERLNKEENREKRQTGQRAPFLSPVPFVHALAITSASASGSALRPSPERNIDRASHRSRASSKESMDR